ncbi:hypothetical protein ACFSTD_24250 [Novosphingobium colocasiae]
MLIMGIKNKLTDDLPSLQTEAQALSLLGLHVQRFIPAISTNVNGAAVAPMAVISLAALRKPRSKSITIGLAAISLFLLLLIDAKSFAIAAFAALGLFTLFRSFPSVLATIAVVIPALPPAITLSKDFSLAVVPRSAKIILWDVHRSRAYLGRLLGGLAEGGRFFTDFFRIRAVGAKHQRDVSKI